MPRVLVTDASRASAIAIIRSLGRRGFDVVAADSNPRSPGFASRYRSSRLLYPPPRSAPEETVAALLRAVREHRVDLLVPVTDEILLPLSRVRPVFEEHCVVAAASPEGLRVAGSKSATLELAAGLGVPVPRTARVTTVAEARERGPELGWPVVLKPESSRLYGAGGVAIAEVAYAANGAGLAREMARFEGRCPVLLQEYTRGDAVGVELLLHRGRPLAAFQHRRLREFPPTGGASPFRESVALDRELYAHAVRLLAALEWTGLAMVEFKLGAGGPRLMEINGRIWGSLPLAVKSGMDFPARMAELYLSGPPDASAPADTRYEVGIRSRNLELELVWIAAVLRRHGLPQFLPIPSRREGLKVALRLLTPGDGFDVLCRDDPRPGIAELANVARKVLRRIENTPQPTLSERPGAPNEGRRALWRARRSGRAGSSRYARASRT